MDGGADTEQHKYELAKTNQEVLKMATNPT